MCIDPVSATLLAASAGMSAAGSAISRNEADADQAARVRARNDALKQSLERQRQFGEQARGMFDERMKDYGEGAQDQKVDQAQDKRADVVEQNIQTQPEASAEAVPLAGSTPEVVKGEIAKRALEAYTSATDRARKMGKLGGYGDTMLGNQLGIGDTARRVDTIGNFSRQENALLPMDQDFAEIIARRPPSMWGPVLSAGGQIVGAIGGRGGFNGANIFRPTPISSATSFGT